MTPDTHPSHPMPSVVAPPTILFNPVGATTPPDLRAMPCPNCGSAADKTLVLTVDVQLPDNPAKRLRVLRCPACTANFYDSQVPPDYAEPALNNRGRVPFYVQQGAGVSLITKPLAQLPRGPGTTYMEVGCGYGFGLDFALNTRGWTGLGIDPAPLAALGRDALNLPIELRYLRDDDEARGTIDVVLGSEVIEHVPSPSAFVRTLKAMLKPGGVLILTTPNGDDIDPAVPSGIIIPLLSPSLHLVIQNRVSLTALLHQAGFAHVAVEIDSHSLVAFASDAPLQLEQDRGTLRHALRDHLEHRARTVDPASDLFLAFAGRAFGESVNDGDMAAADRAWALIVPGVKARFGLQIDALESLPAALATCSLEEMATLVPLNLGGMLYARAIRLLADGAARASLEPSFRLAAQAAAAMRRALGELAMEDGQTEDIGWTAQAEAILCAAEAGDPRLVERLQALPPAPNGGARRRESIALRAMTGLVNAGQLDQARELIEALQLGGAAFTQEGAERTGAEQDALFGLAVVDSQIGSEGQALGNPALASQRFRAVRQGAAVGSGLWWSALRGEAQALGLAGDKDAAAALAVGIDRDHPDAAPAAWALTTLVNLGRYAPARAIAARSGLASAAFARADSTQALGAEERTILFSLAMLDAEVGPGQQPVGDPGLARARFRRLRAAVPAGEALWWAALRGEAQAMGLLHDTVGLAALVEEVLRAQPGPEAATWAVPHLLNAGQHEAARALAARPELTQAIPAAGPLSPGHQSLLMSLAALDVHAGDARAAVARDRFRRVRSSCVPGSDAWWAALRGEAQALALLDDQPGLAAVAERVSRDHPEVDSVRWALPTLVNAGRHATAREVAARSGLTTAAFTQPGSRGPLSAEERDLVFFLAVLDAEIGPDGRAAGDAAMARGRFARVRRVSAEGSGLWWAALRGELQALDLLDAHEEAATLTSDVEAGYPHLEMPADILARIGKA